MNRAWTSATDDGTATYRGATRYVDPFPERRSRGIPMGYDSQRTRFYMWQIPRVGELLGDRDRDLGVTAVRRLLRQLADRYMGPGFRFRVRTCPPLDDVPPDAVVRSVASYDHFASPPEFALYKVGSPATWSTSSVLHEFAHALTGCACGTEFQGVEKHGPEFVGTFNRVVAEHFGIDEQCLFVPATEAGLRIRKWPSTPEG